MQTASQPQRQPESSVGSVTAHERNRSLSLSLSSLSLSPSLASTLSTQANCNNSVMTGGTMTIINAELDDSASDHLSQPSSPLSTFDHSSGDEQQPGLIKSQTAKELGKLKCALYTSVFALARVVFVTCTHTHIHFYLFLLVHT